jgi:hypothetical protein
MINQGTNSHLRPAEVKRELNDLFRSAHPEIPQEITLSKIRAIKEHMLEIGKELDLEISSLAHAYVYFEKLVIKVYWHPLYCLTLDFYIHRLPLAFVSILSRKRTENSSLGAVCSWLPRLMSPKDQNFNHCLMYVTCMWILKGIEPNYFL